MCGIFGLINGTKNRGASNAICKMFADGIALNSIRGTDSVGIMQRDHKATYADRALGTGMDYVDTLNGRAHIDGADTAMFTVAHNRAATEGSVSLANCHPFESIGNGPDEYVIGVHNGTLNNWKSAATSAFSVDSDWAIDTIRKQGFDAFKEFTGAWAFVWSDIRKPEVLHITRNSSRPMYIAYVKNQDRMVFASEYQMLTWIAERNNVELEPEIINLQPAQIYEFDLSNPRRFTKTSTPYKTYQYPSRDEAEEERRGKYVAGLRNILFGKDSKKDKESTPPPVINTNVVGILPAPVTRQPSGPTQVSDGARVSAEEVRIAKAGEVFQRIVSFEPFTYDSMTRELWGSATVDGCIYTCVLRQVSEGMNEAWKDKTHMSCSVLGASVQTGAATLKDMTLVLSRVVNLPNKSSTGVDLETNRAGEELAATIAANIEKFQRKNEDDNSQKSHALS